MKFYQFDVVRLLVHVPLERYSPHSDGLDAWPDGLPLGEQGTIIEIYGTDEVITVEFFCQLDETDLFNFDNVLVDLHPHEIELVSRRKP